MAKPIGRPSLYSQELADAICARLAAGESLNAICAPPEMPAESTVRAWALDDVGGFSAKYTRAREIGYARLADELIEIADDSGADVTVDEEGRAKVDGEVVQRAKLRVDTRKWLLSKVLPKIYGDKQTHEVSGKDGQPLKVEIIGG